MTDEAARRNLKQAEKSLSFSIEQLVAAPSQPDAFSNAVQHTADLLQGLRETVASASLSRDLTPGLRKVQEDARRAQLLLDAAAAFYCGCISATLPEVGSYTPDGQLQQKAEGGRFHLHA